MENWLQRSKVSLILTLVLYVVSLYVSLLTTDLSDIKSFSLSDQQENIIKIVGIVFVILITVSIMAVEYVGLKFIFKKIVVSAELSQFKILFLMDYSTKFFFISLINLLLVGQVSSLLKGIILAFILSLENYYVAKHLISKNNKTVLFTILPFLIIAVI